MTFKLSERSKKNREGVNQKLIEISDLAIQITMIDFGHGNNAGKRSDQQQHQLFLDRRSKVDGYSKIGKHQLGEALDFYAYVDFKASWKREHLAMVAAAHLQAASMLGYKIKWGGLWRSKDGELYGWDMPHIQLIED